MKTLSKDIRPLRPLHMAIIACAAWCALPQNADARSRHHDRHAQATLQAEPPSRGFTDSRQTGLASFYAARGMVLAHRKWPKGTPVEVTNLANGRNACGTVAGTGPFVRERIVDVSTGMADVLGFRRQGVARVMARRVERCPG